jgi:ribosomal protein S18 acetylase RimI-like enzyme
MTVPQDPAPFPTLSIRPLLSEGEAETCAALMASSEPFLTLKRDYETSLQFLLDPRRERYVALVGDRFAGFLVLNLQGAFVGYLQTICLAPKFRGQGLGAMLIAFAEERIFREHRNVFLCVSSFNPSAQRLYQRLGYSLVGELTDYLIPGHSELLMRKTRGPILLPNPERGNSP